MARARVYRLREVRFPTMAELDRFRGCREAFDAALEALTRCRIEAWKRTVETDADAQAKLPDAYMPAARRAVEAIDGLVCWTRGLQRICWLAQRNLLVIRLIALEKEAGSSE